MNVHPYVFFSGNCAEAFHRYQEILGGELQVMTMADLPEGEEGMPGAEPHHVMHAALTVGDGLLMGSDDPTGDNGAKLGVAVTFVAPDEATAARIFAALMDGGTEQMPFAPTFWSKGFGAGLDRYGVPWMVDTEDAS